MIPSSTMFDSVSSVKNTNGHQWKESEERVEGPQRPQDLNQRRPLDHPDQSVFFFFLS